MECFQPLEVVGDFRVGLQIVGHRERTKRARDGSRKHPVDVAVHHTFQRHAPVSTMMWIGGFAIEPYVQKFELP